MLCSAKYLYSYDFAKQLRQISRKLLISLERCLRCHRTCILNHDNGVRLQPAWMLGLCNLVV